MYGSQVSLVTSVLGHKKGVTGVLVTSVLVTSVLEPLVVLPIKKEFDANVVLYQKSTVLT